MRLLAGCLMVFLTASFCVAQPGTLSADARRDIELRPGVVLVYIELAGSSMGFACKTCASGTGFLYRPDGYLITNGHVAQLANAKDADAAKAQKLAIFDGCMNKQIQQKIHRSLTLPEALDVVGNMRVESALTVLMDNGSHFEGEIKAYSDPITSGGKDVAIIKIDGNNLPTVPLGDSDKVNVNDHVFVIGYPGAAEISHASETVATSSDGIISAVKNKDYTGTPLLQTNANINHGNSGGPAFDASGRVIGIATFGKEEPGFNFLVPISTAKEFVRQAGADPQRGAFDNAWHEALDAYSDEEWSKAHSLLGRVLEILPNQPEALRLQAQASADIPLEDPVKRAEEYVSLPVLVGIGFFVLLALGVILWLILRKAKPSTPSPAYKPAPYVPPAPAPVAAEIGPTKVIEASPKPLQVSSPQETFGSLHVSGGPLTGNRFPIPKAGLLIGRDPTKCSVVLADDSVSKEHAWVVPLDNGVAVIDRNSANGTFVNSVDSARINKVVLRHGDRVYLGRQNGTVFTYYST
jgi:serine protease Do